MDEKEIENLRRIIKNYPADSYYGKDGKIILIEEDLDDELK